MGIIETHSVLSACAPILASTLEPLLARAVVAILTARYLYIRLEENFVVNQLWFKLL